MQYIIEIDEKYYVQIFKEHYRLFYIFEMILSILLVLVTGGFVIVFYNHVYISEVIRLAMHERGIANMQQLMLAMVRLMPLLFQNR